MLSEMRWGGGATCYRIPAMIFGVETAMEQAISHLVAVEA